MDGQTTDGRTTDNGACLYYKLPGAFGSGELKSKCELKSTLTRDVHLDQMTQDNFITGSGERFRDFMVLL